VQIRCFCIVDMPSSMSNLNMRSDFVCGAACDEKVPDELPIALLNEPLGNIRRHGARCRGELNPQDPNLRALWVSPTPQKLQHRQ
jgi:hypothetical protein